jgi:hypothetical protein
MSWGEPNDYVDNRGYYQSGQKRCSKCGTVINNKKVKR